LNVHGSSVPGNVAVVSNDAATWSRPHAAGARPEARSRVQQGTALLVVAHVGKDTLVVCPGGVLGWIVLLSHEVIA